MVIQEVKLTLKLFHSKDVKFVEKKVIYLQMLLYICVEDCVFIMSLQQIWHEIYYQH